MDNIDNISCKQKEGEEKMNKTLMKTFIAVLMILIFVCGAMPSYAQVADLERDDCMLTIEMRYAGITVSSGSFNLYRVGDAYMNNQDLAFKWIDKFNCTVEMDKINLPETAPIVLKEAKKHNLPYVTKIVDSDGKVEFKNLQVGLYIVEQQKVISGYKKVSPFFVYFPQLEEDGYNYDVNASVKAQLNDTPLPTETPNGSDETPDNTPDNTPNPTLPQTGQLNWPIPLLAICGVGLIMIGFILRRKNNDT